MKKWICILATFTAVNTLQAQQPLVINKNNFNVPFWNDSMKVGQISGVALPTAGANQTWDYSSLVETNDFVFEYKIPDKTIYGNASFIGINLSDPVSSQAQLPYEEGRYVDSSGYYIGGSYYPEMRLDISTFTGGAGDSTIILEQYNLFTEPQYLIKFPCTYGTTFTNNTQRLLNMSITVNGEGIVDAPLKRIHYINEVDTVVGWGSMILPYNGGKSNKTPVLMIKKLLTVIDSLFLDDQPAPQPLLTGFGVTQGQKTIRGAYVFVRENNKLPLMQMATMPNYKTILGVSYDPRYLYSLGAACVTVSGSEARIYPTPAALGQDVVIAGLPSSQGKVYLYTLQGAKVYENNVAVSGNTIIHTGGLNKGIYIYQMVMNDGTVMAPGKIVIE